VAEHPYIKVEKLTVAYGDEVILRNENFILEGSGLVMVIGPNGSGKTTLFKTILGLIPPLSGRVIVNDVDVTGNPELAGKLIGYVPQILEVNTIFPISVKEVVESAITLRIKPPRLKAPKYIKNHVEDLLSKLGLRGVANKPLKSLSGGQRQRAFLARALVWNPDILLLDEPLSAVDPKGKADIVGLIAELAKTKLVIVSSHDPSLFLPYTKSVIVMNRGIAAIGPPCSILKLELLKKVYGDSVVLIKERVHVVDSCVR